jgi:hypothetical protein
MSALDKLLLAAQGASRLSEDPPAELVRAALCAVAELRVQLADGPDDEDGPGSDDHSGHPTFKALRKKGLPAARASRMCAMADKRAKTTALADAAAVALAGLAVPEHDWVEATAGAADTAALSAAPTGGAWADPGYLGKRRFLIDTSEHARLSLSYVSQPEQTAGYSPAQLTGITARVQAAASGFGISVPRDAGESAAVAALLSLSVLTAEDRRKPSAHTLGDSEDYPIPDEAHLSAAVARYKQGKLAGHSKEEVVAHIRSRARALGKTVDLSTGTGLDEAADLVVGLARAAGHAAAEIAMHHGPFTGSHSHSHFKSDAHDHPHSHYGDNSHDAGPTHNLPAGPWVPGGGKRS